MTTDISNSLDKLRQALGAANPPNEITQEDFDGGRDHLYRLARLSADEEVDGHDLCEYMNDLLYTEIQVPFLLFVLPFCLKAWSRDLRAGDLECAGFVDYFYPVLVKRGIFERHLKPTQGEAVLSFMRATILDEIDDQQGLYFRGYPSRPYRWIGAITTYGVIAPDIERIWTSWWSVETVGRAIATVQYISCLMYSKDENPVFAPYSREEGGGPPCLWDFDGHLYENRWQQSNVDFLENLFKAPERISEVLARAVDRLADQPEHDAAARIMADLPSRSRTLMDRCAMLPLFLATPGQTMDSSDWPS
jgi:hypothetical protein